MAHIGSPSAGWYTDPAGLHRARYWDGASWTEQVRDDLGGSEAVGAATVASGPHAAAQTVAGVAEAVAAVAANDLALGVTPEVEPPLVVDLGTDAPWPAYDAVPALATAPVVDPFAGVAEVAPVGPAPGWYPDPAERHQARLWDGSQWTERVADHGIEGLDPIPSAPGATTVDPAVGAWSSELLTAAAHESPTGESLTMSAGQISLASLPQSDTPVADGPRAAARPSPKVRVAGGLVTGGGIALLLGSATTWMSVTGPRVGDAWSATGLDLGDGRITIVLGLLLAVLGAAILTGRMPGGVKVAAMGSLVAGAAALAVTAVDIADVADRASRLGVPAGAVTNVGTGLWVCFVGALVAVGGGLMAFANRP